MTKKVVVFGATGEIGGRIAAGCVRAGHQVTGVSRGTNVRHQVDTTGVTMVSGDQYDENFIMQLAKSNNFDTVIYSATNLDGIKLCHKYFRDVENVILCSSTGTYVPLLSIPASENNPWREKTAVNFHEQSVRDAWAIDQYLEDGFPITILRPTCIAGYGRVPLELWGSRNIEFYQKLRDSKPVVVPKGFHEILLQVVCNDDLASAFVNAVDRGKAIHGEVFIVSSENSLTLKDYLDTAMEFLDSSSEVMPLSFEELLQYEFIGEKGLRFLLEHMSFSIDKARQALGYEPRYTAQDGLKLGLQWCRDTKIL